MIKLYTKISSPYLYVLFTEGKYVFNKKNCFYIINQLITLQFIKFKLINACHLPIHWYNIIKYEAVLFIINCSLQYSTSKIPTAILFII